MRFEFVLRRILRCIAHDFVELAQFWTQRELHKERFDKLFGVINPARRKYNPSAFARRFGERILSHLSVVRTNVNRHVRLEIGGVTPAREIANEILKEISRWLCGDKPVRDDDFLGTTQGRHSITAGR